MRNVISLSGGLLILILVFLFVDFNVVGAQGQFPPADPSFDNPLGASTFVDFLSNLTRWLLGLVGFLAMLALVWGGIRMIISFGNEQGVEKAKEIIKWAVIGLVLVILSYAIIRIVSGFLGIKIGEV